MVEPASSTGRDTISEPFPDAAPATSPASVLLVTPRWTRDGGIAAHVQASAAALAARGIEVHVLAKEVEDEESVPGVSVLRESSLVDRRASTEARLGAAASLAVDLVHLHQIDDPDIVGALRERSPVVISAHGYTACTSDVYYFQPGRECTRAHGPGCIHNLAFSGCAHTRDPRPLPGAYRRTTRGVRALANADLVISYSSAVDRHLANNGIAHRRVIPLFTTLEHALGSGHEDRRRVVFAGRIVPPKGVSVLIEAAREVDGEFVICGEGWELERLRASAARLGIADRVHFRGWLAPEELARELAEASVVVLPSVWPEPFGLVGIEALSAGRPVVASATGGVEDWLDDGVSGLLAIPGDASDLAGKLTELLADPLRQGVMGQAGRRAVAERFSKSNHVEAILDAYGLASATWRAARRPSRA
jgi:glycosyltransferase involved in cell wall biosynthesis